MPQVHSEAQRLNQNINADLIDQFFIKMAAIYPYKWSGQFANEESVLIAKEEWHEGLEDLTVEQIKKGLSHCRKNGDQFPPSIPQFRQMCLPTLEEMNVIEEEEAYYQLSNHDYSNPLVHEISKKIDLYSWNQMTVEDARKKFARVYDVCVKQWIQNYYQKSYALALTKQDESLQLEKKESESFQFSTHQKIEKILEKQNSVY